jgi:hypothetical protein
MKEQKEIEKNKNLLNTNTQVYGDVEISEPRKKRVSNISGEAQNKIVRLFTYLEKALAIDDSIVRDFRTSLAAPSPWWLADYPLDLNELVSAFEKMYGTAWGARLEAVLRNSLIVLIENELPLTEISLVLQDSAVRDKLLRNVKNETCREYFRDEFNKWPERTRLEWIQSTTNKINAFFSDERIRRIFASPKSSFSLRDLMDNGKILLINLSKGDLGEKNSYLLGSLFLTKIQMEAMKRGRIRNKGKRRLFYLYIDEFQNFAGGNFTGIINETGKYNLSLIVANQSLAQLTNELRQSVLSCGLQAYFRVPRRDAELLAKEAYAGVFRVPPRWEECFARLQSFPKGVCLIKSKSVGGIVEVKVPTITPAWEGMNDEKFEVILKDARVGEKYLRDNAEIEKEYQARREKLKENEPESFRERKKK